MPLYESVFIARPDIPAQEVENISEKYETLMTENGGSVAKREYWGLRNLAYRIKKSRKGHYVMLHIDAPAAAVAELERNMRLSEDVIRYMTIRVDAHDDGPSIMMQTRQARDDRGRRDGGRRGGPPRPPRSDAPPAPPAADASVPSGEAAKSADTPAAETATPKVEAASPSEASSGEDT